MNYELNKNMPTVRFPEFNDDWEHKELNELAIRITKKNTDFFVTKVLTNSAINGIVSQEEFFDKKIANSINLNNYYVSDINDFIYNPRISQNAPVGPLKRNKLEKGVFSPLYTVLRFKEGDVSFFEYFFETTYWHRYMKSIANYGARFDRMNITNESLLKLPLPFPTITEQKHIANFFTILDNKINQLKEKKALLVEYKKGVMQKIFSQELRFRDDDGKEFKEWEEKKLGEIGEFKNGINKSSEDFGFGFPFINLMDVFGKPTTSNQKFDLVNANEKELKLYEIKKGNVLFIRSSVKKEGVGETTLILNDLKNTVYSGFLIRFRDKKIKLDLNFKKYCFSNRKFREDLISLSTTSANTNINQESLKILKINLPCLEEQTKIANFLSKIDDKIKTVNEQIEKSMEYKKGLLQQMFV